MLHAAEGNSRRDVTSDILNSTWSLSCLTLHLPPNLHLYTRLSMAERKCGQTSGLIFSHILFDILR